MNRYYWAIIAVILLLLLVFMGFWKDWNPTISKVATRKHVQDLGQLLVEFVNCYDKMYYTEDGVLTLDYLQELSGLPRQKTEELFMIPKVNSWPKGKDLTIFVNNSLLQSEFDDKDFGKVMLYTKSIRFGKKNYVVLFRANSGVAITEIKGSPIDFDLFIEECLQGQSSIELVNERVSQGR